MINSNHVANAENYCPVVHNSPGGYKKPIRLKNVITKAEAFDSLHLRPCEVSGIFLSFFFGFRCVMWLCFSGLIVLNYVLKLVSLT